MARASRVGDMSLANIERDVSRQKIMSSPRRSTATVSSPQRGSSQQVKPSPNNIDKRNDRQNGAVNRTLGSAP